MRLPTAAGKNDRALIIEGGGMRGSFAGGVLAAMRTWRPAHNFDMVVAVSAGSCDAAYFVTEPDADQSKIAAQLNVWRHELASSRLISVFNLLKGRGILNQEYLIDRLLGGKYRMRNENLDHPRAVPLFVVLSNMHTQLPEYVRATRANVFKLLRTATSLPIATRGRQWLNDTRYTDGGVLDPLPVEAVLRAGYRRLTVVLNNPLSFRMPAISRVVSWLSFPRHRGVGEKLRLDYHLRYNRAMDILNAPPPNVELTVVSPRAKLPAGMITRDEKLLSRSVDLGLEAGYRAFRDVPKQPRRLWGFVRRLLSPAHA